MHKFALPKTPHGNAYSHFYKMFGFFFLGTVLSLTFQLGASYEGSFIAGLISSAVIAAATLVGGIFSTMLLRNFFGLVQTGRLLQYGAFALVASVVLAIFGAIFPSVIAVSNALLSGVALFVFAFLPATLTGTVPWRKRSWLPIRRKVRK